MHKMMMTMMMTMVWGCDRIPTPKVTTTIHDQCVEACAVLAKLGCQTASPKGQACLEICLAADKAGVSMHPACVSQATSCQEADELSNGCPVQP